MLHRATGRSSTIASSSRLVPRLRVADAAGDREDAAVVRAVLERGDDLLVGDLLALEVALHQRVGDLATSSMSFSRYSSACAGSSSGIGISRQLSRPAPSYS